MTEEKFEIKNSAGLTICGKINIPESGSQALLTPVVLLPGFKGFMEMPFIKGLAEGLVRGGFSVLRFDPTNGLGESEGDIYNGTVTGYLSDVSAVLDYFDRRGELGRERLTLFGTSMGGLVATLAAGRDSRIKRLITHSAAFDWNILRQHPDITQWREGEWIEFVSKSKGMRFKVGFDLFTDGTKYDAYGVLQRLTIPKLFLHSGKDEAIPVEFSKRAFRQAANPKKLLIINGASHNITNPVSITNMTEEIDRFLRTARLPG